MFRGNVEVVRRFYAEFARDLASLEHSAAALEALFDPEVSVDQTRRALNPATYHGYQGVQRGMEEIREAWERFSLEPERFIDSGDQVVVIETVRGLGRGSGVEVVNRAGSIYTLRAGRIVRLVVYWDPSEALEAAGLEVGGRTSNAEE